MNYSMFYWKILWFAADAYEDDFEREICDFVVKLCETDVGKM